MCFFQSCPESLQCCCGKPLFHCTGWNKLNYFYGIDNRQISLLPFTKPMNSSSSYPCLGNRHQRKWFISIEKDLPKHSKKCLQTFQGGRGGKKKNNNYMKTSVEASCNLSEQQFFLPINGLLQCCSKQLAVAFLTGSLIEWNQGASGQPRGFSAATFNGTGSLSLQINLPELNGQLQRRIAKDRACE